MADAGIHGSVTIATNMAGRGTDIKLDDESKALGGLKIIGTERMSPAVLIISSAAVPAVRAIRVSPDSICLWRMTCCVSSVQTV